MVAIKDINANKGKIAKRDNSGTDGVGIDWAEADSTINRLENAKITTRSTEKLLLVLPMIKVRVGCG